MSQPSELNDLFREHVKILAKPGETILESLSPRMCDLLHHAYALSGEVGELQDALKKFLFYSKDIYADEGTYAEFRSNVIEELGDIEFYLQGIRSNLTIGRELTLQANISKLSKRYPMGYSNEAALARADKKTKEAATKFKDCPV